MPPVPRIKLVLCERRLTVAQVARDTGYSRTYVSAMVNGRWLPSPQFREAAARYLDVPEGELFEPGTVSAGGVA